MKEPGFPTFYKAKAMIARELKNHLATYQETKETFPDFCRRMRPITGMGFSQVKNILEEDYPELKVEGVEVMRRE